MVKMVTTSGYILSLMMMAGQGSDGSYGSNKCGYIGPSCTYGFYSRCS